MSRFLKTRKNKLNNFFFQKFQEQVKKSPGFQPVLSEEDFQRMVQEAMKAQQKEDGRVIKELPPVEIVNG